MATLKRKITARKGHRNHAEKLLNHIDQNLDDRVKIKSLINILTEKDFLTKQLDNEIFELIESENDIEKEIESTSELSDKLQIPFAKLENISTKQNSKKNNLKLQIPNFGGMLFSGKVFGINTTLQFILQQ